MRRFLLYRRCKVFYAKLLNPQTGRYLSGRSTGETDRDGAAVVAARWLEEGVPEAGRSKRPVQALFSLGAILEAIRQTALGPEDASSILKDLRDKGLVRDVAVKSASEDFTAFLRRLSDRLGLHDDRGYAQHYIRTAKIVRATEKPLRFPAGRATID